MAQVYFGKLNPSATQVAVIMAGGHGTRFWPLSRRSRPKQFLALTGDRSLIQLTADRMKNLIDQNSIMVVTSGSQKDLVQLHLPEAAVLAEPVGRNTAPCLGFAAIKVLQEVGDVPMLCLPADHLIFNEDQVRRTYQAALNCARDQDVLVTIGITPSAPETGYGYIHQGEQAGNDAETSMALMQVREFVEKPNRATAEQYLESGDYFWNSGTFAWRPSVLLRAIDEYLPDLGAALDRIGLCFGQADEFDRIAKEFDAITKISVDYGVMEQAQNVLMVPGSGFEWNDVGSWSAWADCAAEAHSVSSAPSNIAYNTGETVFVDASRSAVYGEGRAVAVVGLEDVIVVETKDAVLVCHRDRTQDVKEVVEYLDNKGRKDLL